MAFGAIVALLFAPLSGEELRSNTGQEAAAEREKVQGVYEKARRQLQERTDKMQYYL